MEEVIFDNFITGIGTRPLSETFCFGYPYLDLSSFRHLTGWHPQKYWHEKGKTKPSTPKLSQKQITYFLQASTLLVHGSHEAPAPTITSTYMPESESKAQAGSMSHDLINHKPWTILIQAQKQRNNAFLSTLESLLFKIHGDSLLKVFIRRAVVKSARNKPLIFTSGLGTQEWSRQKAVMK